MRKVIAMVACFFFLGSPTLAELNSSDPSSGDAFSEWAYPNKERLDQYMDFIKFLDRHDVDLVVQNWQLWRVDNQYASRCGTDYFAVPPREKWAEIIPTLKLIRDEIIPVTGPVEVVSAWRSPEINLCVNGAKASKHLSFAAVDLVATDFKDRDTLFGDLCALQARIGRSRQMGLGAYYDPDRSAWNRAGRFHIDTSGYRTWGSDYTSKTNPCPQL